jgi:hypothetical protein
MSDIEEKTTFFGRLAAAAVQPAPAAPEGRNVPGPGPPGRAPEGRADGAARRFVLDYRAAAR